MILLLTKAVGRRWGGCGQVVAFFGGKWIGGLTVNGACRNNLLSSVLVSTLTGRFDYVTLRFCGLLLGFMGDCMITLSAVVAMLVHP